MMCWALGLCLFCLGMHLGQISMCTVCMWNIMSSTGIDEGSERDAAKASQDALATLLTLLPPLPRAAAGHPPSPFLRHSPLSFSEQLSHFHFHAPPLLSPILFPTHHIRCPVCTTIQQRPSCLREQLQRLSSHPRTQWWIRCVRGHPQRSRLGQLDPRRR